MILVVGDVMDDVIVRPEEPAAPNTDRRATIICRPGGSGANIAGWLGWLGVPTRFVGRVGAADAARHAAALTAWGVDVRLARDPLRATGLVVAVLGADGARDFFTDRGANGGLCDADLPDSGLDGVRALHVSGHVFFEPGPREAARRLMRAARARGVDVSVDAGSAGWLGRAGGDAFRGWTEEAGLCFANADEAGLLGEGFPTLVVTRGAAGATGRGGGELARVAAHPAAIVDGTGAGDAFAAGYLAAWYLTAGSGAASVQACLEAGAMCAARSLGTAGGRPEAPAA